MERIIKILKEIQEVAPKRGEGGRERTEPEHRRHIHLLPPCRSGNVWVSLSRELSITAAGMPTSGVTHQEGKREAERAKSNEILGEQWLVPRFHCCYMMHKSFLSCIL